ncbi:Eco57I restriction-modification methylase domain-containing protein [Rhodobacter calidifons]|nr:hypothetical protein [Rhodobacter calidifons]
MGLAETALVVADGQRREVSPGLDEDGRKRLGQFMTPATVARMLAGQFDMPGEVRLLDAGAGMGALTAAFVEAACSGEVRPRSIAVTCYEVDPGMVAILRETLARCASDCARAGIDFHAEVVADDYILRSAEPLLAAAGRFNCAILNPPYGKINTGSRWRAALRSQGIETVNLYTAFVALALQQLEHGGQLVAITPRCWAMPPPSPSTPLLPPGLGSRCGWPSCCPPTGSCTGPRSCWPCPTSPATRRIGGKPRIARQQAVRPQPRRAPHRLG